MAVKNIFMRLSASLPYFGRHFQAYFQFKKNACFPAGHYYSTIISVDDIKERAAEIWEKERADGITGITLNPASQIALVKSFVDYYNDMPFGREKKAGLRYYFENRFYSYTDAIFLYAMIRHYRPKQIIEVGSGF